MGLSASDMLKQRQAESHSDKVFSGVDSRLTFALVIGVDTVGRTVSIRHVNSSLEEGSIPYLSSIASSKRGTDYMPMVGDIALLTTTTTGTKVIIGFMGGANRSNEILLKEGDMLTKSMGDSIMKQDNDGNLLVMFQEGSYFIISKEGRVRAHFISVSSFSDYIESEEIEVLGKPTNIKRIYSEKPKIVNESNIDEIIAMLVEDDEPEFKVRVPLISYHEINKIQSGGNLSLLDVGNEIDYPIVKSMEIRDVESGAILSVIDFDSNGNVKIKGNKIVFEYTDFKSIAEVDYEPFESVSSGWLYGANVENKAGISFFKGTIYRSTDISAGAVGRLKTKHRPSAEIRTLVNLLDVNHQPLTNAIAVLSIQADGWMMITPLPGSTLTNARRVEYIHISY